MTPTTAGLEQRGVGEIDDRIRRIIWRKDVSMMTQSEWAEFHALVKDRVRAMMPRRIRRARTALTKGTTTTGGEANG